MPKSNQLMGEIIQFSQKIQTYTFNEEEFIFEKNVNMTTMSVLESLVEISHFLESIGVEFEVNLNQNIQLLID